MEHSSPFATLGIAPTLDAAEVKRAYFAKLAQHPPHADAEAFRCIRAAYEQLSRPGGLAEAYLASPLDLDAELRRYRDRYDAAIAGAREAQRAAAVAASAALDFIETISRLPWQDLPAGAK